AELWSLSTEFRSAFELLYRPEDWLLVAGREVRPPACKHLPSDLIPRHPEFNKWWENLIQSQFFRPSIDLRNGFMRYLYRSAVKNQVHFESARGLHPEKPEGFVSDELSSLEFRENPSLRGILTKLKRDMLWSDRPDAVAREILFEVLKGAERFFVDVPAAAP